MISVSESDIVHFRLEEEKNLPEHEQTIFYGRPMTIRRSKKIMAFLQTKGAGKDPLDEIIKLLGDVISGWKNLKNQKGEDVPFKFDSAANRLADESFDNFTVTQLNSIFAAYMQINQVSDAEIKN